MITLEIWVLVIILSIMYSFDYRMSKCRISPLRARSIETEASVVAIDPPNNI